LHRLERRILESFTHVVGIGVDSGEQGQEDKGVKLAPNV
jgi:hypothetical protein